MRIRKFHFYHTSVFNGIRLLRFGLNTQCAKNSKDVPKLKHPTATRGQATNRNDDNTWQSVGIIQIIMTQPALIFLPGTMCDARLFAPQIAHFSDAWEIQTPTIEWHEGGMAGLVAKLLSQLPPRFALVGLSLGGIVAMEMLRQATARISHIALLNTNDGSDTEIGCGKREADFAQAKKEGLENFMRQKMIPRYLHKKNVGREELENTIVDMALGCGTMRWREQMDLLKTRQNARQILAQTKIPMLIACGEQDRICPPALHQEMAAGAGGQAKIFSDCGHLSTIESPMQVNESLTRLLSV